jgi:large subunit ribosomal protein L29
MAILKTWEIRKLSPKERKEKLRDLQIQLIKFRSKINTGGQIESPGLIKEIRRTIARIKTIDHEEKLKINHS